MNRSLNSSVAILDFTQHKAAKSSSAAKCKVAKSRSFWISISKRHWREQIGDAAKSTRVMTPAAISWSGTWSAIKAGADERKLRLHAGTNNAEKLERILQLGTVNANASDEHGRTALHIAAAKGRDTIAIQ